MKCAQGRFIQLNNNHYNNNLEYGWAVCKIVSVRLTLLCSICILPGVRLYLLYSLLCYSLRSNMKHFSTATVPMKLLLRLFIYFLPIVRQVNAFQAATTLRPIKIAWQLAGCCSAAAEILICNIIRQNSQTHKLVFVVSFFNYILGAFSLKLTG